MQKLSLREPRASAPYLKQDSENIMHFSLMDALPVGDTLALNRSLGTLSYISCTEGRPTLVQQQQFTDGEMRVLLPLCPLPRTFARGYVRRYLGPGNASCA